jgi:LysM repeat protein
MMKCAPLARLFLLLIVAFSFIGCSQFKRGTVSDEKDPHFIEGKKRSTSMDWDGAIESFERALQSNPENAAAHFELGVLFDQRKNDFGAAIYHYQRHLKLRTNSPMAEMANTYIVACKRELAKSVSFALVPRDVQRDLERFSQTNALLRQQVDALHAELARRPQYITNYITNLVKLPQFDNRSSARLTQPATLVPPEEAESFTIPPESVQTNPVRQRPNARQTQVASSNARRPTGGSTQRNTTPTTATASGQRKTHRVRPGDTLDVIARRYGVSVAALKAANPSARNGARSGQQLIIPER